MNETTKPLKTPKKRRPARTAVSVCPYCHSKDIRRGLGHWECVLCGQEGSY